MAVRCVVVVVDQQTGVEAAVRLRSSLAGDLEGVLVGVVDLRPGSDGVLRDGVDVYLPVHQVGVAPDDPRSLAMVAAGAECFLRDLVVACAADAPVVAAAEQAGCRTILLADHLVSGVEALVAGDDAARGLVGLGPHPPPWPEDERLDPELLVAGDRRNVADQYRYWREAAIIADLDRHRVPLHVAVENWQHDLNIGTVVRNANAFNVAAVHIVGKRRWNRRGAMATDRYLTVRHHPDVAAFARWAADHGLSVIGIDNIEGAVPIEAASLPEQAVLVFGQEGPGLSPAMVDACSVVCGISQRGSTRSINAGVASGIALYAWSSQHVESSAWPDPPPVP